MKYADAWEELRTTVTVLKELYRTAPGFEQALAVVVAMERQLNFLEEEYE